MTHTLSSSHFFCMMTSSKLRSLNLESVTGERNSGSSTMPVMAAVSLRFSDKLNCGDGADDQCQEKQPDTDVFDNIGFQPVDDPTTVKVREHRLSAKAHEPAEKK